MVWYKAWLDTRWRFTIGFALLACAAVAAVMGYPRVAEQLPRVAESLPPGGGAVAEQLRLAVEASRDYRGYIWWNWFRQSFRETWTLFAVILGAGGLLAQASSGGALYTLSLPVSRTRLLAVRTTAALGELLVLALVPAIIVPMLSPAVGQSYAVGDALVHALCLFVGGSVFFSLAVFLSATFTGLWRPIAIPLVVAYGLVFGEQLSRDLGRFGILRLMSAQAYYRSGDVPWIGLSVAAAVSAALLYGATVKLARRDF